MMTVKGWYAGGGEVLEGLEDECSVNGGDGERLLFQLYPTVS